MSLEIISSISSNKNGRHTIRGHDLITLMQKRSVVDMIFLLWRGDFPSPREKQLLEAMLVASVEHGVEAPSLFIPRVVASTGNSMNAALAASTLAMGTKHGGAIEGAAQLLISDLSAADLVTAALNHKRRLSGYGHKIYKDHDPRSAALAAKARSLKFYGPYFKKAYTIEKELAKAKGSKLPLNVDGAIAAGLLELDFDPRLGQAFFIIPRLIGAAAHVLEEISQGKSYHRLHEKE